ncbi:ABC transporter substrate-binding protein [Halogeometricum borinquense]|uniref:ABC transporter substrate-binding protein n=1 Tax=Halogeometricum borinquense TaxID=60847 RepID=A0A6C0UE23_9EURY|nr:ABC transporter substrate-binding protein [Halogeometricum borinquense]QIB73605.1 ABC transporter substrate-binding protein [Halogeometricum borinquense]QIQ77040.1 ABC transporter substrate-binding protein [Halogeometricum borinquense]
MPSGNTDKRIDRRSWLKALGVGGAAGLAGCSGNQNQNTGTSDKGGTETSESTEESTEAGDSSGRSIGGTYREALSADAKSLNFLFHSDANTTKFVDATMDYAYDFKDIGEIVPMWVESYTEKDKKEWTFTLRDNLRWSDPYGDLTAEDWVYTAQNLYGAKAPGESKTKENWAGVVQYSDWKNLTIEKAGKRKLTVTLPEPQPAFIASTAFWGGRCLPKDLVKGYVEDKDIEGLKQDEELNSLSYTGNLGPYDYEEWQRESRFVATRADDYYLREVAGSEEIPERFAEAPYFEKYELKIIGEESTRLASLKEGDLTYFEDVPSQKVEQFQQMDHLKFRFPPNPFCSMAYYNQRSNGWEMLQRKEVRRALSTAVSKKAIAENIYRGFPTVAHTFQPEWSPWYLTDKVEQFGIGDSYGSEKARKMMKEALSDTNYGYDGDKLVDGNGEQVELSFVYRAGSKNNQTVAEFFKQELAKIGIKVAPTNGGPFNTLQNKYMLTSTSDGTPSFNAGPDATSQEPWDLMYGVALNAYPINPDGSRTFWVPDGGFNFYGYEPEAPMADLYDTAQSATDEKTRKEAFAKIFAALSKEQPTNFLNFSVYKNAYDKNYMGMPAEGEFDYLESWDSTSWYLAKQ